MINRSSLKTFTTILSPLACLELLSTAQAQEGDLGGGNTNERFNALLNLGSGGFNNGLGWYSEWFLTTGFFNSAVGGGGERLYSLPWCSFGKIRVESPSHPRRYRIRFQR